VHRNLGTLFKNKCGVHAELARYRQHYTTGVFTSAAGSWGMWVRRSQLRVGDVAMLGSAPITVRTRAWDALWDDGQGTRTGLPFMLWCVRSYIENPEGHYYSAKSRYCNYYMEPGECLPRAAVPRALPRAGLCPGALQRASLDKTPRPADARLELGFYRPDAGQLLHSWLAAAKAS
jgi:hypothetical protein